MNRDFEFFNPTQVFFGRSAMESLPGLLALYGENVLLAYGGGSIRQNGVYDQVIQALRASGKRVTEFAGIQPNPTYAKVLEGGRLARSCGADLILAVGGGSVIDCAKAVAIAAVEDGDLWTRHWLEKRPPEEAPLPVGAVLTMVGTGSEMNGGSVITNHQEKLKIGHVFGPEVYPKFSILNPNYTLTLPKYQMVAGIYDIMNHITEQYFSDTDDCTSDYLMEGLMRSLIHSSRAAVQDSQNYEARSNIMWIATWALNTLVAQGKTTDWMVHMIGQSVGAYTDATHGMTLSAVSLPYYRHILPYGVHQFKKFAVNVWGINPAGKSDEETAQAGLDAMEAWMKELGLALTLTELGVTEDMLPGIVQGTFVMKGGYHVLDQQEILDILKASL